VGDGVPAAPELLLRLRRAHRRRDDLQRGARLSGAEEPQRGDDPAHARRGGGDHAGRHRLAGPADRLAVRGGPGPTDRRRPRRVRAEDRHRAARRNHLRLRVAAAVRGRRRHRPDSLPGREHRLHRFPGARVDPRPGPLPAPTATHPGRPARLLQRHPLPGRLRDRADRRLPGRGDQADPALHRRRLCLVHAVPGRHDPALEPLPAGRTRPTGTSADDPLPGDQQFRHGDDRQRAGDRGRHEVPARRVDRHRCDDHDLSGDAGDPSALRPGLCRTHPRRGAAGEAGTQPRGRTGQQGAPADPAGDRLRAGHPAGQPDRGDGERRRQGHPPVAGRVGTAGRAGPADRDRLAVPGDHSPDPQLRGWRPSVLAP